MKLLSELHGSFPDIKKKHNKYFFLGRIVAKGDGEVNIYDNEGLIGSIDSFFDYYITLSIGKHPQQIIIIGQTDMVIKKKYNNREEEKRYKRMDVGRMLLINLIIFNDNSWEFLEDLLSLELIPNERNKIIPGEISYIKDEDGNIIIKNDGKRIGKINSKFNSIGLSCYGMMSFKNRCGKKFISFRQMTREFLSILETFEMEVDINLDKLKSIAEFIIHHESIDKNILIKMLQE